MSLINLWNVPKTPQELEIFLLSNEADHNLIVNNVMASSKVHLTVLPLRPLLLPGDLTGWLIRHATMHTEVNDNLQLGGNDLMVLNFSNVEQSVNWFYLHAQEHRAWHTSLSI